MVFMPISAKKKIGGGTQGGEFSEDITVSDFVNQS